jgi:hypothetical protein
MNRPLLELADIVAAAGQRFMDRPPAWFTWLHLKILLAIARCRTVAMGGHLDQCSGCGHRAISYNSCRNRHCPKCQSQARDRWLAARRAELLATPYAHVVFTLPHQLAPLALQNKEAIYGMLFRCSAQTLIEIAADPERLGAEIGSSAFSTPGIRSYSIIPTFTVSWPPAAYLAITPTGYALQIPAFFSRRGCSAKSSAASFWKHSSRRTVPDNSSSTDCFAAWLNPSCSEV